MMKWILVIYIILVILCWPYMYHTTHSFFGLFVWTFILVWVVGILGVVLGGLLLVGFALYAGIAMGLPFL